MRAGNIGDKTEFINTETVFPLMIDFSEAGHHPIGRRLSQAFHEMGAKCSEPQGASIRWV